MRQAVVTRVTPPAVPKGRIEYDVLQKALPCAELGGRSRRVARAPIDRPARAADAPITIALAARAPTGHQSAATGLTGGDNWAIRQIFDTLAKPEDGTFGVRPEDFRPSLAESWERSEDAKVWTYKLRQGVKFHKGYGEMTSEDVAFTFGRHLDPKIVTNTKPLYSNIASVEAPDRYTIRFILKRPDPLFNGSVITTLAASILSRKAFEERGDKFNLDPIGTGPYQVEGVSPTEGILSERLSGTFRRAGCQQQLRISFIADTTARTLAFASGQVDMIEGVRAPGWIPTMRQRSPQTIFDATAPGSFNTLHLNLTRPPLNDLRVRQAIRYAINNDQIAAAFAGLAVPMVGIIAPQFAGSVKKDALPPELRYPLRHREGQGAARRGRPPERRDDPVLHQPARGLCRDHADHPGAAARGRDQSRPQDHRPRDDACGEPQGPQHRRALFLELSAGADAALPAMAVDRRRGEGRRSGPGQLQPLRRRDARRRRAPREGAGRARFRQADGADPGCGEAGAARPAVARHRHAFLRDRPQSARRHRLPGEVGLRVLAAQPG